MVSPSGMGPSGDDAAIFREVLQLQHRWPWATYTAHLFARSAWWAAHNVMATAPDRTAEHWAAPAPEAGRVLFVADQALAPASLELLTRMAAAMHLTAENFAIWPHSTASCWQDLAQHLRPKMVVALGSAAVEMLAGRRERLSQIHGSFLPLSYAGGSCVMMPIFHPDFLLINPSMKRPVWQDLQKAMRFLAE
ncbi:MAG: hypothetical protein J6Y94_04810 [Bacteriovoracaceae bacterium]|nr:hypothetical protein [Bacteriovoracaceae bacterium]